MIITIDGPSGTGKSTVARKVADALRIPFFDTGAMYRSVAWYLLENKVDLTEEESIRTSLTGFKFNIDSSNKDKRYFVGETDVTEKIRTQKISDSASLVSSLAVVRELLWKIQRSYVEKSSAVFEGRDMGTVVFPFAEVKIYLSALPEVRAKRRMQELQQKYPIEAQKHTYEEILKKIKERDDFDSNRSLAPLRKPDDAFEIDTSDLAIEEVVKRIITYTNKKSPPQIQMSKASWLQKSPMGSLYRSVLCLAWCIFKVFYRLKVYGWEHYYKGSAIIACNHTSFLDPPIASISWPEEVHFLARDTLFKNKLFGKFISALNAHPVSGDVADVKVFKTICTILNEGKKVILFPEGTRSLENSLGYFKPGIALLVSRTNSAIIPTYIHGTYEIWSRYRKFPKLFGKTACVYGTPILWKEFSHLDKKEAQQALAQKLMDSIKALKEWYDAGAIGVPP